MGANALFKLPIAELATLGAGISSLIPTLRTVTETSTINTGGLYRLLNQSSGDVLKVAKDDNLWGTMHTAESTSNKAAAKQIGGIPVIKEGPVDELMHDGRKNLEKNAEDMENIIKIYNQTESMYVDGKYV